MASIRKLPSGHYRLRWRDWNGKERGETLPTHKAVLARKNAVETQLILGRSPDPKLPRQSFGKYLTEWLDSEDRLSRATKALYETQARLRILPGIGGLAIGGIQPADLRRFYQTLRRRGVGIDTVEACHRLISRVLSQAVTDGIIPTNPAAHASPPRAERGEPRVLEPDEVEQLAGAINPRYSALILLSAYGGLRFGEVAGLRWCRISNEKWPTLEIVEAISEVGGHLEFGPTKTRQSRTVILPKFLGPLLRDYKDLWLQGHDYDARCKAMRCEEHETRHRNCVSSLLVFTSASGFPLSRTRFRQRYWIPAVTKVGLAPAPTFHDLRHSQVHWAVQSGAHPKAIQERLGHASIRTTLDRYGGLFPTLGAQLAADLEAVRGSAVARRWHEASN